MKEHDTKREKDIILLCGQEVETVSLTEVTGIINPVVLARVNIDLSCFCKSIVSIDFSTFIQVNDDEVQDESEPEGIELVFELRRNCDGIEEVLKEYKFVRNFRFNEGGYITRNSFDFTFCDFIHCKRKCCTYTVQLVSVRILQQGIVDELIVENSAINALVQDRCV